MSETSRARLFAADHEAGGAQGLLLWWARRRFGDVPGIVRVLLADPLSGLLASLLYQRVNFGASRLGALQREMLATVVNGKIGGAP